MKLSNHTDRWRQTLHQYEERRAHKAFGSNAITEKEIRIGSKTITPFNICFRPTLYLSAGRKKDTWSYCPCLRHSELSTKAFEFNNKTHNLIKVCHFYARLLSMWCTFNTIQEQVLQRKTTYLQILKTEPRCYQKLNMNYITSGPLCG